jgi:hypothetical protein
VPVTPAWQAPTSGQQANAGAVNQLLGTHAVTYVWTGAEQAHQSTAGSGGVNSDGLWIAQSFATASGQTTTGYVVVTAKVTGTPAPWTLSIQASSAGAPSGTALASAAVPKEFLSGTASAQAVMLPVTGLAASTTYWIVAQAAGDASDYFTWSKSNQVTGASTSTTGTSWTAQSYGLLHQAWDGTPVPPLAGTWEDSGARWTALACNGSGQLTGIEEYTAGQTATGYAVSSRALSYSAAGLLTGVA